MAKEKLIMITTDPCLVKLFNFAHTHEEEVCVSKQKKQFISKLENIRLALNSCTAGSRIHLIFKKKILEIQPTKYNSKLKYSEGKNPY